MIDDLLGAVERGFTAWEIDHLCDPEDDAGKLAVLLRERVAEVQAEACAYCDRRPCDCEPLSQREYRAMYARHGSGPVRVVPR